MRRFVFYPIGLVFLALLVLATIGEPDLGTAADDYTWERMPGIADGPVIYSLAAPPDGQVVFAGTEGGGVFRSNGGGAFESKNSGLPTSATPRVSALAVAPDYSSTAVALLGTNGSGVYRTNNGGDTWWPVSDIPADAAVYSLAFAPDGASAFAAIGSATKNGILISRDGGSTWHAASLQPDNPLIWQIAVSPKYATDSTVFAGGGTTNYITSTGSLLWNSADYHSQDASVDGGVFKSTDRGESWTRVFDPGINGVSALLMAGDAVYAGTPDGGVFRSTDGGSTWSPFDNSGYPGGVHALAATPQYGPDTAIFAGTWASGVFRTIGSSLSWEPINSSFPRDDVGCAPVQALVVVAGPDRVYAGTGGRVTEDGQGVWRISMPLRATRIYLPMTYKNAAGR